MDKLDLQNPGIQKIAVSAVLALAVLGVFFFTHFLPFGYPASQEKLVSLKSDYEQKSTELARARATVSRSASGAHCRSRQSSSRSS